MVMKKFIVYLLFQTLGLLCFVNSSIAETKSTSIHERLNDLSAFLGTPKLEGVDVIQNNLPEPYRFLLVQPLMTKGIEEYYQRSAWIEQLHREMNKDSNIYSRAILMMVDSQKQESGSYKKLNPVIVEVAFIKINFNELPKQAIASILNTNTPFGKVLLNNKISTFTKDRAYFSTNCNADFAKILKCKRNQIIFGRINTLVRKDNNQWVAQVVEILSGLKCKEKQCSFISDN